MPQKGAECEAINFDPLVMADGIAPTNDPILLFRSPTYAVSFSKRLGPLRPIPVPAGTGQGGFPPRRRSPREIRGNILPPVLI